MSDTPVTPPPTRLEKVKAFIGDLARPFAIYVTSGAAAAATVKIAWTVAAKTDDFSAAAIFMTAVLGGVAGLYGAKAWENAKAGKSESEARVAEAAAPTPPVPAPAAPHEPEEDLSAFGGHP